MPDPRPRASDFPTPDPYGGNDLSSPETNQGDAAHAKENAKKPRPHPR